MVKAKRGAVHVPPASGPTIIPIAAAY